MLRITPMRNANQAKSYYTQSLACEDGVSREAYYSEGQEAIGIWGGKGADRLGLSGSVEQEQFAKLCDNIHPNSPTNESLTPRTSENRRVGYDMNFHVPKSVSLYQAITGDDRVLDAARFHYQALRAAGQIIAQLRALGGTDRVRVEDRQVRSTARRDPPDDSCDDAIRRARPEQVHVPQHPAPADQLVVDLPEPAVHLPRSPAGVRPESATRP